MTPTDRHAETIVAIASPAGRGAVSLIRASGPDVPRIAEAMIGALPAPRTARLARFLGSGGEILDQGLALYFPAPASFTGEHVLELQGHGGPVVTDALVQRVLALGARMARPGEFSERAFLNGKLDIAQAEAVADLIDAGSQAAARAAVRSMQGDFSKRINDLQSLLNELRVQVEAAIDFPDDDIEIFGDSLRTLMSRIFDEFESISRAARQGALLRHGLTIVIAGKPNAGKSSLLNRLAADEVAIVGEQPGTTRDLIKYSLQIDGMPLTIVDTAGLRAVDDVVEAEGVRRARQEIRRADRILYLIDASRGEFASLAEELGSLPTGIATTLVFNKIDLSGDIPRREQAPPYPRIYLSARTGDGLDYLRSHLKEAAGYHGSDGDALSARRRHLDALDRAASLARSAADVFDNSRGFELFAEDLRLAQRALGEITGEVSNEELLAQIFSSFCIGK